MAWRVAVASASRVVVASAWSRPALKSDTEILLILIPKSGDIFGPGPEIIRRARVPTGKVGAESKPAGAAEEPRPAGAEAIRRVVSAEFLVVDPGSDIVVRLGGARGCATGEGNLQGRGECRARERAWQSMPFCGIVSCLETRLNIRILAGGMFLSVDSFV